MAMSLESLAYYANLYKALMEPYLMYTIVYIYFTF